MHRLRLEEHVDRALRLCLGLHFDDKDFGLVGPKEGAKTFENDFVVVDQADANRFRHLPRTLPRQERVKHEEKRRGTCTGRALRHAAAGPVLASRTVAQARRARGLGANTRSGDLGACASGEAISTPTSEDIVLNLIEVIAHIAARFYSSERFWDDDLDVHDPLAS